MKSIKQSVEVQFSTVEISDVIMLLPLMDAISKSLDTQEELEFRVGDNTFMTATVEYLKKVYITLRDLGFRNSLNRDPEIISRLDQ